MIILDDSGSYIQYKVSSLILYKKNNTYYKNYNKNLLDIRIEWNRLSDYCIICTRISDRRLIYDPFMQSWPFTTYNRITNLV